VRQATCWLTDPPVLPVISLAGQRTLDWRRSRRMTCRNRLIRAVPAATLAIGATRTPLIPVRGSR